MNQQMIMEKRNSYVEILEILKHIDKKYLNKVSKKIIEFFEKNKNNNYNFEYNNDLNLSNQKLDPNTLALLAMLNLNFWCENEEHKKELQNRYKENEKKYQEIMSHEYDLEKELQKKKIKKDIVNDTDNNLQLVEYKENFFTKIVNKIKQIFMRKQ